MEEEEKSNWKEYLIDRGYIILILVGIGWFLLRGRVGTRMFDNASLYAGAIIVGFFMFKGMWNSWKNASPKVIYPYGHTTYDPGNIVNVGNFKTIQPHIKAYDWYFKLPGLLVFPMEANAKYGLNVAVSAEMENVPISSLPDNVQNYVVQNNVKPPYLIGYANAEQYSEVLKDPELISKRPKPSVEYLIKLVKEQNELITFLRGIIKGKYKDLHGIVKWSRMIGGKEKSGFEALKDMFTEKGEE